MKSFEEQIAAILENYEVEYNPSDWAVLEKKLNRNALFSKIAKGIVYASIVATIATGLIWFLSKTEDGTQNAENKNHETQSIEKIVSEQIIKKEKIEPAEVQKPKTTQNKQATKDENIKPVIKNPATITTQETNNHQSATNTTKYETVQPSSLSKTVENNQQLAINEPNPIANFTGNFNAVCENSSMQFSAEKNETPVEYYWDFGDGGSATLTNTSHIYKKAGTYQVTLQVVSTLNKQSNVKTTVIVVNPAPSDNFQWQIPSHENSAMQFESEQATNIKEWYWDFGDNQYATDEKPTHTYNKKGNYNVSLRMKNNHGCTTSCRKNVNVTNDFNLLAPNAFSPNGDGKNDTWLPIALIDGDYFFSINIIDRNGQIAYKTSSKNNPWDGRHLKTNDFVKQGDTFKWIAVVKNKMGIESTYGGSITITESMGY